MPAIEGDPRARPLRRGDLAADPLQQFAAWYREADAAAPTPEAAALATCSSDGAPSLRMLLVRRFDERGFVFHTAYESRKGRELEENPRGALLFYWYPLGRQVRIEGAVGKISPEESEAYFGTRPRAAQLAAWASEQSATIQSREALERRHAEAEERFAGSEPPLPPHWGGYRLRPEGYEFWQHRESRLHDRFRYRREAGGWVIERLQP